MAGVNAGNEISTARPGGANRLLPWTVPILAIGVVALGVWPVESDLDSFVGSAPLSIGDEFAAVAAGVAHLAIFMVAIGLLTMAILETAKGLIPLRGFVFRFRINRILKAVPDDLVGSLPWKMPADLLSHASLLPIDSTSGFAGSGTLSWCDVPVEQLIAQIGSITEYQLQAFFETVTPGRLPAIRDQQIAVLTMVLGFRSASELANWTKQGTAIRRLREPRSDAARDEAQRQALGDAESALRAQMERRLDTLHILVAGYWRRFLRGASCVIAATIALLVLLGTGAGHENPGLTTTVVSATFIIGGFFSWFARDLVATVERWRQ